MLVTIGGKKWNMLFAPLQDCDGCCDAPTDKSKKIKLAPRLKKDHKRLLEVIVHEVLHGSDWSKDESWVETTAEDIARILWKVGYRLSEPKEL
jgi:hypothetical protein